MSEESKDEEPKAENEFASLGGKASAAKLSAEERKARARLAARVRWETEGKRSPVPTAICGSPDRPLRIASIEIPCYVLDDGRRVIVQGGVLKALNMSQGTGRLGEGDRLTKFATGKSLSPYISSELLDMIKNPTLFRILSGGVEAYGYEATILADICHAIIQADHEGELHHQQKHIAAQCVVLVRSFTKLGIVAMVDEATGYQDVRERDALAKILEGFVAKELQQWVRTFPAAYYEQIFRLRNLTYTSASKRPSYFGHITNDLVYKRIAPGVLEELRRKNPVMENGQRKTKLFQWLTPDHGHPRLRMHLEGIVVAMKLSKNWKEFYGRLNELYPPVNDTPMLPGMKFDESGDAK